jgi:hypothetical protein
MSALPNIVLVHGAWADGSSWSAAVQRLQADDYTVTAHRAGGSAPGVAGRRYRRQRGHRELGSLATTLEPMSPVPPITTTFVMMDLPCVLFIGKGLMLGDVSGCN